MLLIVFLAALGVTSYLFWMAEQDLQHAHTTARTLDDAAQTAILTAHDLRTAQQAYVASGQGPDFWFARTTSIQAELKGQTAALRSGATTSAGVSAFEDALGVLQDFEQMDGRAREHVRARRMLAASDLIFADGLELTQKIAASIDQGRAAEIAASDGGLIGLKHREIFSLGAGAASALLILLLLLPLKERERIDLDARQFATAEPAEPQRSSSAPAEVEPEWAPAKPLRQPFEPKDEPAPAPAATPVPVAQPMVAVPEPERRLDLQGVARLCGDLARITDTRSLPGLLERTATLIDASGIVLWIADPDGRELTPIMTFGYSPQTVTRLGTISREAENATAAAFRTCLLQTVDTDAVSGGAVAAPLVTPAGCVGVMAAEIRNEGEREDMVLAAAGIVAAQLATLVGPPSGRALKSDVG
jgi:hypothetical protein